MLPMGVSGGPLTEPRLSPVLDRSHWLLLALPLAVALAAGLAVSARQNYLLFTVVVVAVAGAWLRHPVIGLSATMLLTMLDFRTQLGGISLRLYEAVGVAALALPTTWSTVLESLRRPAIRTFVPLALLTAWTLASTVYSFSPLASLSYAVRLVVVLTFVLVCCRVAVEPGALPALRMSLGIGLVVILVVGFLQLAVGRDFLDLLAAGAYVPTMSTESLRRAAGSFLVGHYGQLRPFGFAATPHAHAAMLGCIGLYFVLGSGHLAFHRLLGGVAILQVILADVNGALLGVALASCAVLAVKIFRGSDRTGGVLIGGALAITIVAVALQGGILPAIRQGFVGRFPLWNTGAAAFLERPIIGWGAGSAASILAPLAAEVGYMFDHFHNWYLETAAETGLVGLGLLVFWLSTLIRHAMRAHSPDGAALLAVTVFFGGYGLVDSFVGGGNVAFAAFLITVGLLLTSGDLPNTALLSSSRTN